MKLADDFGNGLPCQCAGSSKEICCGRIGEAEVALLYLGRWLVGGYASSLAFRMLSLDNHHHHRRRHRRHRHQHNGGFRDLV